MSSYRCFLISALAFMSIASAAQPAKPPKVTPPDDRSVNDRLDRKLPEVKFDKVALADAVDFMRDVSGENLFVNWTSLKRAGITRETPVSVNLKDVKLGAALAQILAAAGNEKGKARFTIESGLIMISAVPDPKVPEAVITVARLPDKMDRVIPEVKFDGVALTDAVDFLRDVMRVNITMDWNALKQAGIGKETPVTVRFAGAKLSIVLKLILVSVSDGKSPLQIVFKDNIITLTSGPEPKKPAK